VAHLHFISRQDHDRPCGAADAGESYTLTSSWVGGLQQTFSFDSFNRMTVVVNEAEIPVDQLNPGMYLLKIKSPEGPIIRKIMKN